MKSIVHNITKPLNLTVIAAILLVGGFFLFSYEIDRATAGQPWFASKVTVTTPKPPTVQQYSPGQTINFHVDFQWIYCSNEGGGAVYGRMSNPSPVDAAFHGLGGWKKGISGQPGVVTTQGRGGWPGERVGPYAERKGGYHDSFVAPSKPGRYHFQYELEIRTPEGNKNRVGTVVFDVKDKEGRGGAGGACPANQIEIFRNNKPVCVPEGFDLTCSVEPRRIEVGESATFTARANQQASFTWYEGAEARGAVIGGPYAGTESSLTRTYSNKGIFQVTALARNSQGEYGICTQGIRVGLTNEEDEEEITDEFGNVITSTGVTTPDGQFLPFDRTAGPASVTFDFDRTLTNTTCKGTWATQNVLKCYMVPNGSIPNAFDIPKNGSQDLNPTKYQVKCLALRNGSIVESPERLCRKNPEIREN